MQHEWNQDKMQCILCAASYTDKVALNSCGVTLKELDNRYTVQIIAKD